MKTLTVMKIRFGLMIAVLVMGLITFSGCNNDDDTYLPPNPAIVDALNKLYPGVKDIEWSQKGVYFVADCWYSGNELDVWFDANANWIMTEVEISYGQLPASVSTSFEDSSYADWVIDNLTLLSYPNQQSEYVFEVQQGGREVALYFSEYGGLLHEKDITGADDTHWPNITPP